MKKILQKIRDWNNTLEEGRDEFLEGARFNKWFFRIYLVMALFFLIYLISVGGFKTYRHVVCGEDVCENPFYGKCEAYWCAQKELNRGDYGEKAPKIWNDAPGYLLGGALLAGVLTIFFHLREFGREKE